jgi:arylsulfatase A-like enzyme/Flp pilus assembly protein TadD
MARRPFRRTLIFASVALGTALSAAGGWRFAKASAPVSGPIIVISIDALRADRLPAYGYEQVKTPAIDMLAANGVVFERAYSHAPQTLPAHAALLAGRLPFRTGVRDARGAPVKPSERLLPELLRERGFKTGGVVSGPALRRESGIAQGFDFFDDDLPETPAGEPAERDGGASEQIAETWLDHTSTSRVLLFLHLNEPHQPYAPPDRFSQYAPYDGEIAYADEIVGRLIQYLKKHQLYDRSTILLLSDHGEGLGDHGEQEHGLFVYDDVVRVPLIIKQESNVGAGRRVPDVVQHIDIVPTILELAKAPVPGNLQGRSLMPLLEGNAGFPARPVYSEALAGHNQFGWSELFAVTDGRYQYIDAPREELYDLLEDPQQEHNLLAGTGPADPQTTEILVRLSRVLQTILGDQETETAPGPAEPLANPKDKIDSFERYRTAAALAAARKWTDALAAYQRLLRDEPRAIKVWNELAALAVAANRFDVARDAYEHVIRLASADPGGYLGAAESLLKERRLEEASTRAAEALQLAPERDKASRVAAHTLLARIALVRHDAATAREQALLADQIDATPALTAFVEGRLLYDQGQFADALPWLEKAVARSADAPPVADAHFYVGDTLLRLNREAEAEAHFAAEVRRSPYNVRARAGLATVYHTLGETESVETAITELLSSSPTPESYAVAARLWSSFGNAHQAETVREEARRTFPPPRH